MHALCDLPSRTVHGKVGNIGWALYVTFLKWGCMGSDSAVDSARAPASQEVHVLVVEDEVFIRMMISDAFRGEGFSVIEAFNGDEAVEILTAGKAIDIIFSDVRMPGTLDGLGLLKFVRERFPEVPVILTSGHLEQSVAIAEGARHFVRKPYDFEAVLSLTVTELAKRA
jgi:CheY-like chemotaxis protein